MMKGLAITQKGAEEVSLQEIKEIINKEGEKKETAVLFEADSGELCTLCYHGRSFSRILQLLCWFEFDDLEDIEKKLKIANFQADSFRARCIRKGSHSFSSGDVEKLVGDKVDSQVDLKNPQKTLLVYVYENTFYIGVDYCGFDLGKRSYKVFAHPSSLRGDTAYCLLRFADYNNKAALADPFCGSGTILIEAALYSANKSVHFYDKDKFAFNKFLKYEFKDEFKKTGNILGMDSSQNAVVAARKNAKIAGADIELLKAGIDWLDTKLSEKSIDLIVTNPPQLSKRKKTDNVLKAYDELFNNAGFVLRPKGTIAVITKDPGTIKEKAVKNGFKVKKESEISSYSSVVFEQ